jgi:hypothetical protein
VNFAAFVAWKAEVKQERPQIVDLSETRIASAFADLRPSPSASSASGPVHRCDLARTWCRVRNLPDSLAGRTLVSQGVRDALMTILRVLGVGRCPVGLPSDVYPVYWQIAAESGVTPVPFDTFPGFDVGSTLSRVAAAGASIALLPAPLKLHARRWTAAEAATACRWLAERPHRRLILDGVYSFGCDLDDPTRTLLDTGQILYLDSLSKGWLHEKVFGAAIVPEDDLRLYRDAFRAQPPRHEELALAGELLGAHADFPAKLAQVLGAARATLVERLGRAGLAPGVLENGYFATVERSAEEVLERFGLLTIPVSVFGCPDDRRCLASGLPVRIAGEYVAADVR